MCSSDLFSATMSMLDPRGDVRDWAPPGWHWEVLPPPYKRPNRPQQLSMCRQREDETDREYLTRWSTIHNSCEGVIESQAIAWFAQGCRHGSMLWQRLQREMPATLAETMAIADNYALGDPTQPLLAQVDSGRRYPAQDRDRSGRRSDRPDNHNKRREDRPDYRYGSDQVAAVDQD